MKRHVKLTILVLFMSGLFAPARALVLAGGRGNTNAPTDTAWCHTGWSNTGSVRSPHNASRAGVIYLCDDWFLTTYHAWWYDRPTGVVVNATGYTVDTNSMIRLTNSAALMTNMAVNADVAMFRVTQKPNLPPLNITSMAPGGLRIPVLTGNKSVVMIGSGHPRVDNLTYWKTSETGWVESVEGDYDHKGYKFWPNTSQNVLRWGNNQIDLVSGNVNLKLPMPNPFGDVVAFRTTFNPEVGPDECQVAPIDSGAGVFYKNNGYWELTGLIMTMTQPDGSDAKAVWGIAEGAFSYAADLSFYRDQIMGILRPDGWADLIIEDSASASTNSAAPGSSVSIEITTLNQGDAAAGETYTALYLIPSWSPSTYANVGQSEPFALAAGESTTNTFSFTAPATPGVYYMVAKADNGEQIHEAYENNNQSGWNKRILEVGPDLLIIEDSASASTNSAAPGSSVSIEITTLNQGDAAAGETYTALYLIPSWSPSTYANVGQSEPFALAAGESTTNTFSFTAPATPGVYYMVAKADNGEQIHEAYENNNQSGWNKRILEVGPDLVVDNPEPVTNRALPGASFSIPFTTRNRGNVTATNFYTSLYLVPTWNTSAYSSQTKTGVMSLGAGESVTNDYTFIAPAAQGIYELIAKADDGGTVRESYENNNQSGWGLCFLEVNAGFDYITESDTIRITGYTGSGGNVDIPGTINGKPVTAIDTNAFFGNDGLTAISIPGSVTNIGTAAFSGCVNLSKIHFAGNAPVAAPDAFNGIGNATIYRLPGSADWPAAPAPWAGHPTAFWIVVTGGTIADGFYTNGPQMTITANAPPVGMTFDRWVGDTEHVADVTSATSAVNLPAQAIDLQATYKPVDAYTPQVKDWLVYDGRLQSWSVSSNASAAIIKRETEAMLVAVYTQNNQTNGSVVVWSKAGVTNYLADAPLAIYAGTGRMDRNERSVAAKNSIALSMEADTEKSVLLGTSTWSGRYNGTTGALTERLSAALTGRTLNRADGKESYGTSSLRYNQKLSDRVNAETNAAGIKNILNDYIAGKRKVNDLDIALPETEP